MSQAVHGGDVNGKKFVAVDSDSESSSIGIPSDDDDDVEDHGEALSRITRRNGTLNSLASLETSLPIKKGLSLYYDGRSKSYSNLAEERLEEATQAAKQHVLNKKRRLMNISQKFRKYSKRPSNNTVHQSSMPAFHSVDREDDMLIMEMREAKQRGPDLESLWKI